MKLLPLRDGKYVAIVSRQDYRRVNRYSWHVHFSKGSRKKVGQPYARATIAGKKVYLHRFIMDAEPDVHVDHGNHQTLDCRRNNLEKVPPKVNHARRRAKPRKAAKAQPIEIPQ